MYNNKLYKIIFEVLILLFVLPYITTAQQTTTKPPNIIFILVDDMGWKDLGTYGSTFYETPNIDKLASQGMKFTDAYASSTVCSPSRSSIMTGQYPVHTDIIDWIPGMRTTWGPMPMQKLIPPKPGFNLPESEVTIAQSLKDHGYVTCYAGKWHLGLDSSSWPKAKGFDYNYGGWAAGNPVSYGMGGYFSPYHNPKLTDGPKGEFLTDRLTSETIKFIKKAVQKGQPFFADLSFYAIHEPIQAKNKYIKKFKEKAKRLGLDTLKQFIHYPSADNPTGWQSSWWLRIVQSNPVYAGLIYSVDENVGRIMKTLKDLGIANNTVIVFTSDNGGLSTSLKFTAKQSRDSDNGDASTAKAPVKKPLTTQIPLRYGKAWIYEGGIRVPLIIKWPGVTKPGSVSHFPVINTDFYPTFLEMAGLPPMPKQAIDGVSMAPLLKGKKSIDQPDLYWHYPNYTPQGSSPSSAIREGNWKLIQFYNDNHVELYNLRTDIGERDNLAGLFPQKTAELLRKLNHWKQKTQAELPVLNPFYNPYYQKIMKRKHQTYLQYLKNYQSSFSKDVYDPKLNKRISDRYHKKFKELK